MRRRLLIGGGIVALLAGVALFWWLHGGHRQIWYTGFVEGEERVLRSEVSGRVLAVNFQEGDRVPAGAVVATLDDSDIAARIASGQQQLAVLDAQIRSQQTQVETLEKTWSSGVAAQRAEWRRAQAQADLAERTYRRAKGLMARGVTSQQKLDEARASYRQAESALAAAADTLRKAEAEEGNIALARHQLDVLHQQRELAQRQLDELQVMHAKYEIRAPAVPTVVQTQLLWPGELAQPGTPVLSVLDPKDKYVQIYVPAADASRVQVGQPVEIELDSDPGHRVPGEISFIADEASFTPEKIETRSDRLNQVYRAKVRILSDVERFRPGEEGNVYLVPESGSGETTARSGP